MSFLPKKDVIELLTLLVAELDFELQVRQTDMFEPTIPRNTRIIRGLESPEEGVGLPPKIYDRLKTMYVILKGEYQSLYETKMTAMRVEIIHLKRKLELAESKVEIYQEWAKEGYDQGWKDSRTFAFLQAEKICEDKCDYTHEIRRAHVFLQDYCRYECPRGEKTLGYSPVTCSSASCDVGEVHIMFNGLTSHLDSPSSHREMPEGYSIIQRMKDKDVGDIHEYMDSGDLDPTDE